MGISFTPQQYATAPPAQKLIYLDEAIAYAQFAQEWSDGSNTNRMGSLADLQKMRDDIKQEIAFANGEYGSSLATFSGGQWDF